MVTEIFRVKNVPSYPHMPIFGSFWTVLFILFMHNISAWMIHLWQLEHRFTIALPNDDVYIVN